MRPIDEDELMKELNDSQVEGDNYYDGLGKAKSIVCDMPIIDVRPSIHARWVKGGYTFVGVHKVDEYICSMCDYHTLEAGNYCGNCGAIMNEKEDMDNEQKR